MKITITFSACIECDPYHQDKYEVDEIETACYRSVDGIDGHVESDTSSKLLFTVSSLSFIRATTMAKKIEDTMRSMGCEPH